MYQKKRQRVITENDQDDFEEVYEALSTKLQIVSDMAQIFNKDMDPNMQKMLEFSKEDLRKDIRLLMGKGIDFMSLYKKFGSLLFKSQVMSAKDALQKLSGDKHENLVDLVNEDLRLRNRLDGINDPQNQDQIQQHRNSALVIARQNALQQLIQRRMPPPPGLPRQPPGRPGQPPGPNGQPPGLPPGPQGLPGAIARQIPLALQQALPIQQQMRQPPARQQPRDFFFIPPSPQQQAESANLSVQSFGQLSDAGEEDIEEFDQILQLINRSPSPRRIPSQPFVGQREPSPGPAQRSPSPMNENMIQERRIFDPSRLIVAPRRQQSIGIIPPSQIPQPMQQTQQRPVLVQQPRPTLVQQQPAQPRPTQPSQPRPQMGAQMIPARPQISATTRSQPRPSPPQPRPQQPVQQTIVQEEPETLQTIQEESQSLEDSKQQEETKGISQDQRDRNEIIIRDTFKKIHEGKGNNLTQDELIGWKRAIFCGSTVNDITVFWRAVDAADSQIKNLRYHNQVLIPEDQRIYSLQKTYDRLIEAVKKWESQGENIELNVAERELFSIMGDFFDMSTPIQVARYISPELTQFIEQQTQMLMQQRQGNPPIMEEEVKAPDISMEQQQEQSVQQQKPPEEEKRGRSRAREESKGRRTRSQSSLVSIATRASSTGGQQKRLNQSAIQEVNRLAQSGDIQLSLQIIRQNLEAFSEHEKNRLRPLNQRQMIAPEDLQSYLAPDTKAFRDSFVQIIGNLQNPGIISQRYVDLGQPKKTQAYTKSLIKLIHDILNDMSLGQ